VGARRGSLKRGDANRKKGKSTLWSKNKARRGRERGFCPNDDTPGSGAKTEIKEGEKERGVGERKKRGAS